MLFNWLYMVSGRTFMKNSFRNSFSRAGGISAARNIRQEISSGTTSQMMRVRMPHRVRKAASIQRGLLVRFTRRLSLWPGK